MKSLPYKLKNKNSNCLIVIFQSFNKELYKPEKINHFELENSFEKYKLNCDLLFLKDIKRENWYLADVEQTLKDLKKTTSEYKRVLFTGISSGGFASILYGSLLHVDLVVAVNPQTCLYDFEDRSTITACYNNEFKNLFKQKPNIKKYFDLKNFINKKTIYYLNGWEHMKNEANIFNVKDDVEYKDQDPASKLHDIRQYKNLEQYDNVNWLPFMEKGYVNGCFLKLIKRYNFDKVCFL